MHSKTEKSSLVVVDMLNDFIDGSLACMNAENAVKVAVDYIENHNDLEILYVADHHPANHSSFAEYGGIWPPHCVQGTFGAEVHKDFVQLSKSAKRPNVENTFFKGTDSAKEQYSGYEAVNDSGKKISDVAAKKIIVCGIATEFCVKQTALDFLANGHDVTLLQEALGYVDKENHLQTIVELKKAGIKIA
ncbi:MAG: isochorismatase family protein [Bacteroidales bacterium]|nr:isochorismatase family protein [Bacteroidales bacterium]